MSLIIVSLGATASAATTVYHCTVNRQTVFTDKPCDTPSSAVVSADGSKPISATPTLIGAWRGQTQGRITRINHGFNLFIDRGFFLDDPAGGQPPDSAHDLLHLDGVARRDRQEFM